MNIKSKLSILICVFLILIFCFPVCAQNENTSNWLTTTEMTESEKDYYINDFNITPKNKDSKIFVDSYIYIASMYLKNTNAQYILTMQL